MSDDVWDNEIMPTYDQRWDVARRQIIVAETVRHHPVRLDRHGLRDRLVYYWDRLTRRRPQPAELDAMWAIFRRERRAGGDIEDIILALLVEEPIPGAIDIREALMSYETGDVHPAIWIEWPYRWWAARLAGR